MGLLGKVIFFWLILVPKTFSNDFSLPNVTLPPLQNEFPTKCMGDLGCFETGPPFYHPLLRPLILLPFDEKHITTKFILYTRRNPKQPEFIDHDYNSIDRSSFNPYCPTKIIIHGFSIQPTSNDAYQIMKNAILSRGSYNVILVNWSDSNKPPYFQAVSNARVVGAQIARLIQALVYYTHAAPERFHLIGHSLGAAVAGWAGERIPRLGRITGLDPVGIYFYLAEPELRLDITDADFVDVIITNGGTKYEEGIATIEPIGHVNFYPNGGNMQPGCYNTSEPLKDFDFIRNVCSHMRSVELFIASIFNDRCRFIGTACESYESYLSGRCNERFWWRRRFRRSGFCKSNEMGFHARKDRYTPIGQTFFLKTSATAPFCISTMTPTYRNWYSVKM